MPEVAGLLLRPPSRGDEMIVSLAQEELAQPASRRRGIATAILRQALERARSIGLARALLVCDDANVGSIRTIEACGGVLERFSAGVDGQRTRRYWIVLGPGAASD